MDEDPGGTTCQRTPDGTEVRFDCRGGKYADFAVVEEVWAANTYEWTPNHVRDHAVLDVGANIGAFSLWAAACGAARVVAVEPDPENLAQFRRNLAVNPRLASKITIIEGAAGPDTMYRIRHHESGAGSWVDTAEQTSAGNQIGCVNGWSLAALLDMVEGETIQMKCDIEGSEYALFGAAEPDTLRRILHLAMEFHRPGTPGGLGERPEPPSDDPNPFGTLVTKLAEHHEIRTHGMPSRGGLLWATRF